MKVEIKLASDQGQVVIVAESGGVSTRFGIAAAQAEHLAVELLEMVGRMREKSTTSLFDEQPLIRQHNPPMEWRMNDDGKYLLAMRIGPWRPIILILDDPKVPRKRRPPRQKLN